MAKDEIQTIFDENNWNLTKLRDRYGIVLFYKFYRSSITPCDSCNR
jgi:hypothetical protein